MSSRRAFRFWCTLESMPLPIRRIEPDIVVLEFASIPPGQLLEKEIRRLLERGDKKIILDLAGVKLINSDGVANIVFCLPAVKRAGGQLRIAGASRRVRKDFETTKLDALFPFDADVEAACQALRK